MTVLESFSLDGRIAVVTGGTGLYGTPFATALAEAGAHVVVTSRSAAAAEEAAQAIRSRGLGASGQRLDMSEVESIEQCVAETVAAHGRIDVLVNNAVHRQGRGLEDTTAEDWDATSQVNSRGLFLMTQHVATVMIEAAAGSIVNIGSIYGLTGPTFELYRDTKLTMPMFYSYDKAGMVGLTRYLACALGPHGIRVNCLAPGGLFDGSQPDTFVDRYRTHTPLGRMATERDAVGALLLLASDAGAYITGTTLPVDGGFTAH